MGQLKEDQAEIDAMKAHIEALTAERDALKNQLLHTQKAFLMQQRELNVLQMEKLEEQLSANSV